MENQIVGLRKFVKVEDRSLQRSVKKSLGKLCLDDLLLEVVIMIILSKLPLVYLFDCRYISHNWRNLIKELNLAKLHFLNCRQNPGITGLILYSVQSLDLYAIQNIEKLDVMVKLKNLPFRSWIPNYHLMGSCDGLLCVADDSCMYRSIFICNPVTGDWHLLPDCIPIGSRVDEKFFGFGYDSRIKKYKVVRIRETFDKIRLVVETHTLGSSLWQSLEIENQGMIGSRGRPCGVFVNGNLHWFSIKYDYTLYSIVSFDTERQALFEYSLPQIIQGHKWCEVYLGEIGGLLTVGCDSASDDRFELWQMLNYGENAWSLEYMIPRPICCHRACGTTSIIDPVGIQRNGNFLVYYRGLHEGLFSYDPKRDTVVKFVTEVLPNRFEAFPHISTFLP